MSVANFARRHAGAVLGHARDRLLESIAPRARVGLCVPGVTLYGDSIMADGIADRLRVLLPGVLVRDHSVPGDQARSVWRRFPYETRMTDVIVFQQGTNDLTAERSPLRALRRSAGYAIAEGRRVVFTGIAQRADRSVADVDAKIAALAAELGAPFAAWQAVPLDADDGLHPNPAMSDALAQRLAAELAR